MLTSSLTELDARAFIVNSRKWKVVISCTPTTHTLSRLGASHTQPHTLSWHYLGADKLVSPAGRSYMHDGMRYGTIKRELIG